MRPLIGSTTPHARRIQAFSLIEVVIAVGLAGIMFISLYAGFSSGFAVVQLARENLRGTQILQEKMETLRLYTWEQINTAGFIPTNFTDVFYATTQSASGLMYTGIVSIASAPIAEPYSNDLKQVTIEVTWSSAKVLRKRTMTTFISHYGLQNYIY
jgi:type II secretory pathway pseudopilin PulG